MITKSESNVFSFGYSRIYSIDFWPGLHIQLVNYYSNSQVNIEIWPNLKSELLGRVVQSKLTKDKREFSFEFCNFVVRFSVYRLAFF